tara:strand:+ start:590 stop:1054 length:465 start_codon:yes stop_codon:yes gene_type:complete
MREEGFYWVLKHNKSEWVIAEYTGEWWLTGTDENFCDMNFSDIDERRIERPVEVTAVFTPTYDGNGDVIKPNPILNPKEFESFFEKPGSKIVDLKDCNEVTSDSEDKEKIIKIAEKLKIRLIEFDNDKEDIWHGVDEKTGKGIISLDEDENITG